MWDKIDAAIESGQTIDESWAERKFQEVRAGLNLRVKILWANAVWRLVEEQPWIVALRLASDNMLTYVPMSSIQVEPELLALFLRENPHSLDDKQKQTQAAIKAHLSGTGRVGRDGAARRVFSDRANERISQLDLHAIIGDENHERAILATTRADLERSFLHPQEVAAWEAARLTLSVSTVPDARYDRAMLNGGATDNSDIANPKAQALRL